MAGLEIKVGCGQLEIFIIGEGGVAVNTENVSEPFDVKNSTTLWFSRLRIDAGESDGSEVGGNMADSLGMEKGEGKVCTFVFGCVVDIRKLNWTVGVRLFLQNIPNHAAFLRGGGVRVEFSGIRKRTFAPELRNFKSN
jgi:hypothetical protein